MRAGRLRHLIRIEREVEPRDADDMGGYALAWETVVDLLPAAIDPLRGQEAIAGQQIEAQLTHKITTRYYPGIQPDMRVVFDSRIFNIRSVKLLREVRHVLELSCEEGVAT